MNLEDIILSEISHTERQIPYDFTYMWNLKNTTKKQKQKQIHKYREQTDGCQDLRGAG